MVPGINFYRVHVYYRVPSGQTKSRSTDRSEGSKTERTRQTITHNILHRKLIDWTTHTTLQWRGKLMQVITWNVSLMHLEEN